MLRPAPRLLSGWRKAFHDKRARYGIRPEMTAASVRPL